ncbi:MAG: UDP-3-O-acyl-N-acetylglucosamine deacetylase [Endomicrobiales bacterium]|nr:UDP-3-O-acyl-N-acetylglucosamine deacetylase [Endomicrobiales bacterium]
MLRQRTIKKTVSLKGIGLHTGNISKITFVPAKENSGIKFVRTDLPGAPSIQADFKNVTVAVRGTTIASGEAKVHTVEHVLAVCSAFGINNLEIHLTNNEPPVMDGSAKPFCDLILAAGIEEFATEQNYIKLTAPISYKSGETLITAEPCDKFIIDCTIGYKHPFLTHQQACFEITQDTFIKELSSARTFCFDYEIEALRANGLAKGGDLMNAIVIGFNGIRNTDKTLRFQDEFVRHKILDLIGDLSLLARPLKAKITAVKCGHNHNINFAAEIAKTLR